MTVAPAALAALHAACFTCPRPWSATEFASLLGAPGMVLRTACENGTLAAFGLARVVADEAELLTLAASPAERRKGLARALLRELMSICKAQGATRMFLEVAADNAAACALYKAEGFAQLGLRRAYFRSAGGGMSDALVLGRTLV